ncbi:putative phage protein (TIGR02216 family) [Rhizobium aquaticum]|uniref:Phage protein (TIGR02216 family) n=1 Tax=Rhizobium aquaticum TaxID=1549636 RepID=A0ABV2J042_9HYPH
MSAAAEEPEQPRAFPWREAIHAGLFLLRLSPRDFWALTPIEFHAITGGLSPRFDLPLKDLMARYPDDKEPIS